MVPLAIEILGDVATVAMLGYVLYLYVRARRNRPRLSKSDIVYQEWMASGNSQRGILTMLAGARHCLRLVVTKGRSLVVTSWFPFSLITPIFDLEHVIPFTSISSIRHSRFLGLRCILLTYDDADRNPHTLRLRPVDSDAFLKSLESAIIDEGAA